MNVIEINATNSVITLVNVSEKRVFEDDSAKLARLQRGVLQAQQDVSRSNGVPLWQIAVSAVAMGDAFDIAERENLAAFTGRVVVAAEERPNLSPGTRIEFDGLVGLVRSGDRGSAISFQARAVRSHGSRPTPPKAPTNGKAPEPANAS